MNNKLLELTNNSSLRSQKKQEDFMHSQKKQFLTPLKNIKKKNFNSQSFSENVNEKKFGNAYNNKEYDVT
jgi:hypothetical protein